MTSLRSEGLAVAACCAAAAATPLRLARPRRPDRQEQPNPGLRRRSVFPLPPTHGTVQVRHLVQYERHTPRAVIVEGRLRPPRVQPWHDIQ